METEGQRTLPALAPPGVDGTPRQWPQEIRAAQACHGPGLETLDIGTGLKAEALAQLPKGGGVPRYAFPCVVPAGCRRMACELAAIQSLLAKFADVQHHEQVALQEICKV